jgi:hypothetical protein
METGMAVFLFPADVTVIDGNLDIERPLCLVAGLVRDWIAGSSETPERFRVSLIGFVESREERT